MRYLKCALLALMLLNFQLVFSQTVFVTSNGDSGTGTLREALAGIPSIRTTPYIINFRLTGDPANDANRTIRLRSQLPNVPSNVIIDGTSQLWPALGVSGAKIIIEPESPAVAAVFTSCLTILNFNNSDPLVDSQTKDVEIYGLYIKDFTTITNLQSASNQVSGIVIDPRAKNIKIGAPGKGNVIGGTQNGISIGGPTSYYTTAPVTDISIRSNLIGLHYDGLTAKPNITGINARDFYEGSIGIGGDNTGDGNVIAANKINTDIRVANNYSGNFFTINVVNNKIGTNYTGTVDFQNLPLFSTAPSSVEMIGLRIDATRTNLYVRDNIISGNRTSGLSIANADFIVTGNSIGTGVLGTETLGNGVGVKIETGASGFIGGDTDPKSNKIANNEYGIESLSGRAVTITRNSMYCNRQFSIGKTQSIQQPYVQVLVNRPNFLSGKATPNSTIELFYSENCRGICEGKRYFATVITHSDGRWDYTGPITGNVIATSTYINWTTSPFSTAAILDNEVIIEPITCNGNGSITVVEPREGITFTWNRVLGDGSRVFINHDQKILNLQEGTYELITDDGCKAVQNLPLFEIRDQKLTDLVVSWPSPQCGQTSFIFSAAVQRGKGAKTFKWLRADGTTAAIGTQVTLPAGTYKLVVTDEAGCELSEQGPAIVMRPTPQVSTATIRITNAACGFATGSIKGLQILTATGNLTYKWNLYDNLTGVGAEVAQTLDLENVFGGYYQLTVYDEGTCSPVTRIYNIPVDNSVTIDGGLITKTTCNTYNGAITGVRITVGNSYQWIGPTGAIVEQGIYSPGQVLELRNLAPGTYILKAKNTISLCENTRSFQVDELPPVQYILNARVNAATCGLDNGSVLLSYTSNRPVTFEWKDAMGTVVTGTDGELKDLAPGTYRFFTYDINHCETVFGPYVIERTPILVIEPLSAVVVDDGCSLLRGSVTGIRVNGGIPPYNYSWENEAGTLIQSTKDLIGVPEGKYRLILRDNTSCGLAASEYYTVSNPSFVIETPVVNDMRVCYATEIMLPVMAPEEGTYQMFQTENDLRPIMESTNGNFVFKIAKTADYFIRRKLGTCTSEFVKVHLEVTNDNLDIKNTMSPNGDGMNDFWMITGLPDYGNINIKLYTRSGQLVYESIGKYDKPFDGRFRGKELPAGAYYYRIDLRADCKPIGGSLTLLR